MSEQYCAKCERCHEEGLRDDEDCPYYGEPNGCNHPQYGYGEKKETWREIVAEMRGMREFYGAEYRAMADRIEAACKTLEETGRIAIQSAQVQHDEEVDALKYENAKLRRALEPVMKINLMDETTFTEKDILLAVNEAQAIMKCQE